MGLLQAIVLGAVQGIFEWIPISSEGLTVLVGVSILDGITVTELIRISLYLHLGTFLAALVYFRNEVWQLIKRALYYRSSDETSRRLVNFYVLTTLVSGGIGLAILKVIENIENSLTLTSKAMILALGVLLLVTGVVQIIRQNQGPRQGGAVDWADALVTGVAQGLSVLPGISRSGFTVSTLLLRGFDDTVSLKLSFIMSLPIVLVGNILLNTVNFAFTAYLFIALLISFLVGLATIHLLLKFARRVRFGWFIVVFSFLVFASAFII